MFLVVGVNRVLQLVRAVQSVRTVTVCSYRPYDCTERIMGIYRKGLSLPVAVVESSSVVNRLDLARYSSRIVCFL
jgi:hypothetical protein